MNKTQALQKLKSLGTAQNRKIYARHGAGEAMFGVSYADLGKTKKEIKTDHPLAESLWASGNHDARVLATMVETGCKTPDALSFIRKAAAHRRKKTKKKKGKKTAKPAKKTAERTGRKVAKKRTKARA